MNGPVNPDTLPPLEAAVHAPPGRYGLYRDVNGIVAIAVRPRAGRPLYEVTATIPMTHGTDTWTVKGHTVSEAFEALQASIRTARMMTITLTFATADEALREVRTRCLANRAEPCDALWTATDAAIRDKNDHRYLLCSDGVFRPEVIVPPIKPGNFGAPPPKERDTSPHRDMGAAFG